MNDAHRLGGSLSGGRHRLPIRVYYEDTDFSGVVYHASYLRFMERGRTECLRALGMQHGHLSADVVNPVAFVVRRMTVDFLKPARMDDLLIVETWVVSVVGAAIEMRQRVLLDDTVLTEAAVKTVAVANGRARRVPSDMRTKFLAFAPGSGVP